MPQQNIRRYLKHGTLPQLRVFEASVRLGSLARAAEELHMAAPTACVQVKKLSDTVGAPLFEHVGKRIYPTEVGRRVYESCGDVFRAFSALEESLAHVRALDCGALRLAACSAARHFAPRLLAGFAARHPGIGTALRIENRAGLLARLQRNDDDLYLFADPAPARDVVTQAILANPYVVLARRDHALARARRIAFGRVAAEPFIAREPGSGTREVADAVFARHGLQPRVRMEMDSDEAIRAAIADGLGIAILPRYTLAPGGEDARLRCLDVEGFPVESSWRFVYPIGRQLSAAARAFIDFARAETRPPENRPGN